MVSHLQARQSLLLVKQRWQLQFTKQGGVFKLPLRSGVGVATGATRRPCEAVSEESQTRPTYEKSVTGVFIGGCTFDR